MLATPWAVKTKVLEAGPDVRAEARSSESSGLIICLDGISYVGCSGELNADRLI